MKLYIALISMALLSACAPEKGGAYVIDGELIMPRRLTKAWTDEAKLYIAQGKVRSILCTTEGGYAPGAIEIAEMLQRLSEPVRATVPAGYFCNSAGALIWFAAPYRSAQGSVALHIVGYPDTGRQDKTLSAEASAILAKAGASYFLRDKVLHGTWDKPYTLSSEDIRKNMKSPE